MVGRRILIFSRAAVAVVLPLILAGCPETVNHSKRLQKEKANFAVISVFQMDPDNKQYNSSSVRTQIEEEIIKRDYNVINAGEITEVMRAENFELHSPVDARIRTEIGKQLGANYAVYCFVRFIKKAIVGQRGKNTTALTTTLRCINTETLNVEFEDFGMLTTEDPGYANSTDRLVNKMLDFLEHQHGQ